MEMYIQEHEVINSSFWFEVNHKAYSGKKFENGEIKSKNDFKTDLLIENKYDE